MCIRNYYVYISIMTSEYIFEFMNTFILEYTFYIDRLLFKNIFRNVYPMDI